MRCSLVYQQLYQIESFQTGNKEEGRREGKREGGRGEREREGGREGGREGEREREREREGEESEGIIHVHVCTMCVYTCVIKLTPVMH